MLRIERLHLENYRCFGAIDLTFEPDLTVLFAENGGGKTAILAGLATALALFQPDRPRALILSADRDARHVRGSAGRWEPVGPCTVACTATIGDRPHVAWRVTAAPGSRRRTVRLRAASEAIERVRAPGARWPLLAYYGTDRLASMRPVAGTAPRSPRDRQDRREGYAGGLDPVATDVPLLAWLRAETLGDIVRHERGEPQRGFAPAVLATIRRATPGIADLWYDPAGDTPVARFDAGHEARWSELSDGFHVFMGLVGDIARRAVILNGQDGAEAPLGIEGVVLIDEIDLHLHPRWQRVVLHGLRAAFPCLQLIVTTHSPQVLSSAENRQARRLSGWALKESGTFVEGRDSNAILRELMGTDDRDEGGRDALRALHAAIDGGRLPEAEEILRRLRERWGDLDPELIRAATWLGAEG